MTHEIIDHRCVNYKVNDIRIFSERFENDTIVIDLSSGIYYSLNYTGGIVWQAISQGLTISEISKIMNEKLKDYSETDRTLIDLSLFIGKLLDYSLLEIKDSPTRDAQINFDFDLSKSSYLPPTIDMHDDVKDLLLADIVHSVESDGWPKIRS